MIWLTVWRSSHPVRTDKTEICFAWVANPRFLRDFARFPVRFAQTAAMRQVVTHLSHGRLVRPDWVPRSPHREPDHYPPPLNSNRPYQGEVDGTEREEPLSKPVRHLVAVLLDYSCLVVN